MGNILMITLVIVGALSSMGAAPIPEKVWATNAYSSQVSSLRFSPNSASFASGSYNGAAKLWSVSNATLIRTFIVPQNDVVTVAFSPDGVRLFGGGGSGGNRAWRVSDGAVFHSQSSLQNAGFGQGAYSPDGLDLVKGRNGGTLTLHHADTGVGITFLEGHTEMIRHLEFSPDSALLGSSSDDDTT